MRVRFNLNLDCVDYFWLRCLFLISLSNSLRNYDKHESVKNNPLRLEKNYDHSSYHAI